MNNPATLKTYPWKLKWIWGIICLLTLGYLAFSVTVVKDRGLFEYVGIDYRLWYSTGMIIRYHGVSSIYDLNLQSQYQLPLYEQFRHASPESMKFWPLPLPYPSIFTLPMVGLTIFSPKTGFIFWTCINSIGTLLYILFFIKSTSSRIPIVYILLGFLSLPIFLNLFLGQVNLLILVSFGESVRLFKKNNEIGAGLWLAGLLIKPQTLLILIPALILHKKKHILFGFVISSTVVLGCSLILSGVDGIKSMFRIISSWPIVNMNVILENSGISLNSLVVNLKQVLAPNLSNALYIFIFAIILFLIIVIWLPRNSPLATENLYRTFLCTYAATCTLSPHSNIHMAIPMVALGLLVVSRNKQFASLALCWIVLPACLFLLASLISTGFAHITAGLMTILMNTMLIILVYLDKPKQFIAKEKMDTV
jgi:hypothetical protein